MPEGPDADDDEATLSLIHPSLSDTGDDLRRDLFQAYEDARRHKRSSASALAFEIDYERNLLRLHDEIITGRYRIGPSVCFISFHPVQREIFAAGFRDRIVHHLIYNYISPVFERLFINDSYSCRMGRGTSYGVQRADHFIRSCSRNFTRECSVLKLDIKGYFMSIDRLLLSEMVDTVVRAHAGEIRCEQTLLLSLIRRVIFHDPTTHCTVRGRREDWAGLPRTKSLFFAGTNKGLPIGNLTSQLFGNVYLNGLDHFITCALGCSFYGRYVDDMLFVHRDRAYLRRLVPEVHGYLRDRLRLTLHDRKVYLQPVSHGVLFLGIYIKPHRRYIGKKTGARFLQSIRLWNAALRQAHGTPESEQIAVFLASMNAYLGMLRQGRTYRLRRHSLTNMLDPGWLRFAQIGSSYEKLSLRDLAH